MATKATLKEFEFINNNCADMKVDSNGKTSLKCPRCGKPLLMNKNGSSTEIYCTDPNCIKIVYRGI